jgi:WD40 repeat protein
MIAPDKEDAAVKNRSTLNLILTLIGLVVATAGAYIFAGFLPNSNLPEPSPTFSTYYGKSTPIPFPASEPKIAATLPGRIHSFAVSPDMKTIAFATSKGMVLYDLESYQHHHTLSDTENTFSVAWSPDGKKLAMGSLIMQNNEAGQPHLVVWDTSTWKILFEPKIGKGDTTFFGALAWSPNGKFLATSDYDRSLVTFDIQTGRIISLQKDFLISPVDISWSPNGTRVVATGDLGFGFRRWRIDTDEFVRLYDNRVATFAVRLAWSPNGKRIASIHADGMVCFWTAATNNCNGLIKAHHNGGFGLAGSSDGGQLATSGSIIRIWDTQTGNLINAFGLNDGSVYTQLQWLEDGRLVSLETGYADTESTIVRFWDIDTGSILTEFHGASGTFGE